MAPVSNPAHRFPLQQQSHVDHSIWPLTVKFVPSYYQSCFLGYSTPRVTSHFTKAETENRADSCVLNFNLEFKFNSTSSLGSHWDVLSSVAHILGGGTLSSSLNQWKC